MPTKPTELRDWEDYTDREFRGLAASGRRFHDVAFTGCTFTSCDLSLVRLTGSRCMDVRFVESKLLGVHWADLATGAQLPLSVAFERSVLSDGIFAGLNLTEVRMTDCIARGATFESADLTGAVFTGTDFEGARFGDTTLVRADFRGAHGYAIDVARNRVANAKFSLPDAVALLNGLGVEIED